eukprot:2703188-Heterocapsa_arctica.AAC.1
MHAAWTHNRFQPVQGVTPYKSVNGHDYRGEVYEFTDAIMARVAILPATKLDPRWVKGLWIGKTTDSDENIVATEERETFARSVKKIPMSEVPQDFYKQ